jgi:hypothetical protein
MSKISTVNFNGNSVSLTVCPSEDGKQVTWRLTVITKEQSEFINSGSMTFPVPEAKIPATKIPVVTNPEPKIPVITNSDPKTVAKASCCEKVKHVDYIKSKLTECDTSVGKENKARVAVEMLNYLTSEALDFVNNHKAFKDTVIKKCYEFKSSSADLPALVEASNRLLTKLGVPLTVPAQPVTTKPVTQPITPQQPAPWITQYDEWEKNQRTNLMKEIIAKKGGQYVDSIMDNYYAWEKTYKPEKKPNRYQKMSEFVRLYC